MVSVKIKHEEATLAKVFGISDERLIAIVKEFNDLSKNLARKNSASLEIASLVCENTEELVCISFMLGEMAFAQHGRKGPLVLKVKP